MLAFTPEVSEAIEWFRQTHEIVAVGESAAWRRTQLPDGVSLAEQDALLMQSIEVVREVMSGDLRRQMRAPGSGDAELAAFRKQHGRNG